MKRVVGPVVVHAVLVTTRGETLPLEAIVWEAAGMDDDTISTPAQTDPVTLDSVSQQLLETIDYVARGVKAGCDAYGLSHAAVNLSQAWSTLNSQ